MTAEAQTIPEDIFNTACGIVMNAKSLKSVLKHKDVVDAIAAALAAERENQQWQPIETAPKGAEGICWMMLAYGPDGDQSVSKGMRFHDKFYAAGVFYVGGPSDGRQYAFQEREVQPTHWMPLPASPKTEG